MRHKLLLQTNAPYLKTGLGENGRILMNWLAKRDKYDLVYYCTQVHENDPNLSRMPYKCYGSIPSNPQEIQALNQDPGRARDVAYGSRYIEEIVKKEKPTIWLGSDDAWAFQANYYKAEWFKKINSILHITVDSVPVLDLALDQAQHTPHFYSWAGFAAKEMRRLNPALYGKSDFIYGASDISKFRPISRDQKLKLRQTFGIDPNTTIFIYLGRNQLRKEFGNVIQAFAAFKRENPSANAKLLFHTAYSESGNGWDIPKLQRYFGVKHEDVLCTMFCRNCGAWEVKPYNGEDVNCRFCGKEKAMCSANIAAGVSDEELHLVYGLADASISAFTSGGLEFHNVNSLLCGLPLACTNYSCGEDFCLQPFVTPIKWASRHEAGTNFVKATNDVNSIRGYMAAIYRMSDRDRQERGEKGRAWAANEFDIETIGAKWEKVFDAMPDPNWSSITLDYIRKNDTVPMPDIADAGAWVKALYNSILLVEPDPDGFKHWLTTLEKGATRQQVYDFFINRAREDNSKHAPPTDFGALLDRENGKKRALFVIKESIGDCLMVTSLFKSFHEQYPDHDLYIGTDPKHAEVFDGNPYVKKVLPHQQFMEQEMAMIGAGQADGCFHVYFHPAVQSQRQLNYLSADSIAHDLT